VLDYTKVPYTLNGPIEISEKGIHLKNDVLKDQYGNTGTILGNITYKNFKDLKFKNQHFNGQPAMSKYKGER